MTADIIIWNEVIKDMKTRNEVGAAKYGVYLKNTTGENMLQHAYEEALDLAVYLKTRMMQEEERTMLEHDYARDTETIPSKF